MMQAKPILKWAGGKTQLSTTIDERIPEKFKQGSFTYVEPFIGGKQLLMTLIRILSIATVLSKTTLLI